MEALPKRVQENSLRDDEGFIGLLCQRRFRVHVKHQCEIHRAWRHHASAEPHREERNLIAPL